MRKGHKVLTVGNPFSLFISLFVSLLCSATSTHAATLKTEFNIDVEELTDELHRPWAVEVLPNQSLVITERNGNVRIWEDGQLSNEIEGLPAVFEAGQGGLLDVKAHPNFSQNRKLYFTYSTGNRRANSTYLATALLSQNSASKDKKVDYELTSVQQIFTAAPQKRGNLHFSGRIEFLPDNSLVFAVGDGYSYMEKAQSFDSHLGKVIRLNDDGTVSTDNPFTGDTNAFPEIYTLGHRNPQGMFYDHKRQLLFSNEHGPKGGDEINIISAGNNYGWPTITYGVDYSGFKISDITHKEGMEQPLLQWTPSIAPSSLMVYYGNEFPQFYGHILTTTLKYQELRLVELSGNGQEKLTVVAQHSLLKDQQERLRDIAMNKAGQLYIVTDSGKLLKLTRPK